MQGIQFTTRRFVALCALLLMFDAGAATLTVTTLADTSDADGECSLREALWNAGTDAQPSGDCPAGTGDDVIAFESALFSGSPLVATINLGSMLNTAGTSSPTGALTIAPPTGHRLTLQGAGDHGILSVRAQTTPFVLQDTEIHGGRSSLGAGVALQSAESRFTRVRFFDNVMSDNQLGGGALFRLSGNDGLLQLEECEFENNAAPGASGGALYSESTADFDIEISDSVFVNNNALWDGAAVVVKVMALSGPGTPTLDVTSSRFEGNLADIGGALRINAPTSDSRISARIIDSVFRNNRAGQYGGAIAASGDTQGSQQDLVVRRSTFMDNGSDSSGGGAIQVSDMGLSGENSLFVGNDAPRHGAAMAVWNVSSQLPRIVRLAGNSFYRNELTDDSETFPSVRTLYLAAPSDATGWEWHISGNLLDPDSVALLGNSIECELDNGFGLVLTGGANLSSEPTCLFLPGDTEADPQVTLVNTGNTLKPRSLLPQTGSPAIDLWPAADCNDVDGAPLTSDLRGEPRPRDGDGVGGADCDTGAFELPNAGLVTVSLAGTGGGAVISDPSGIDCGSTCSAGFTGGSQLTLTAAAQAGSVFAGWSGECTGTGACEIQVDGDMQVTATFDTASSHVLDVTPTGDGGGQVASLPSGIYCDPLCAASFADGAAITLTAASDDTSVFSGWSGGGCSGTGDCVITLTAATSVSAEFTATHFPVTVERTGTGNGSVTSDPAGIACPDDCEETFARTETVTLTASPASGSVFSQWEGDCSGSGECVLDMDTGPYTVVARFERLRTLSVGMSGGGSGTVTSVPAGVDCPGDCSEAYPQGSNVELIAAHEAGSAFAGWSGDCSGIGDCVVSMNADRAVTATFQTGSYTLDVSITGPGSVTSSPAGINCPSDCSETFLDGTAVELIAAPQAGYFFAGWTGDCSGSGSCIATIDQARTIGARFLTDDLFADRFESP